MQPLEIIYKLHTPEELIYYSNLVHWIMGAVLAAVAALVVVEWAWPTHRRRAGYAWRWLILGAGLFLPLFTLSHHWHELPLAWQATIYDPQQRQHMIMALLLGIAGVAEISVLRATSRRSVLSGAFPTVLAVIGIMFLTHLQHGTEEAVLHAVTIHRYLGSALILAGIARGLDVWIQRRFLVVLWVIFLAIAAALLISYREPTGAYSMEVTNHLL